MSKKSSFQKLIDQDTLVFVDFHAVWCGPCKATEPIVKQLAKDWKGQVKVIKIDIDKNKALSQRLNIRGVPTFALYRNGKQLWRQSGMLTKVVFDKVIQQHLITQ